MGKIKFGIIILISDFFYISYFTKDELIYVMKQLNEDISETLAD